MHFATKVVCCFLSHCILEVFVANRLKADQIAPDGAV